jgi:hypothetical protein
MCRDRCYTRTNILRQRFRFVFTFVHFAKHALNLHLHCLGLLVLKGVAMLSEHRRIESRAVHKGQGTDVFDMHLERAHYYTNFTRICHRDFLFCCSIKHISRLPVSCRFTE